MTSPKQSRVPIPPSLAIAINESDVSAISSWWNELTIEQQLEFLALANLEPESIATHVYVDPSDKVESENDWYEYVVNQDMRFYFDRSHPDGSYNIVYPILSPISASSDNKGGQPPIDRW